MNEIKFIIDIPQNEQEWTSTQQVQDLSSALSWFVNQEGKNVFLNIENVDNENILYEIIVVAVNIKNNEINCQMVREVTFQEIKEINPEIALLNY